MPTPVDEAVIRFGSEREARAHRLLGDGGAGRGRGEAHQGARGGGRGHPHPRRSGGPRGRAQLLPRLHAGSGGPREGGQLRLPALPPLRPARGPVRAHDRAAPGVRPAACAQEEALRQTPEGRKLIRAETRSYVRATRPAARSRCTASRWTASWWPWSGARAWASRATSGSGSTRTPRPAPPTSPAWRNSPSDGFIDAASAMV